MLGFWLQLGVLFGIVAAQRKGFNVAAGAVGGALLGPLAFLLFFVTGVGGEGARRKCPHCAEWIQAEARVCKHCHRDVAPAAPAPPALPPVSNATALLFALGVALLLIGGGTLLLLMTGPRDELILPLVAIGTVGVLAGAPLVWYAQRRRMTKGV